MQETRNAFRTKLVMSRAITLGIRMAVSHTRLRFRVLDKLTVAVILEKTFMDRFLMPIKQTEKKIVPYHSSGIHTNGI